MSDYTSGKDQDHDFRQPGDQAGLVSLHGRFLPWDHLSSTTLHKQPTGIPWKLLELELNLIEPIGN